MSTWRRKALGSFPDLPHQFEQSDATIYEVFFDLLPRVQAAHPPRLGFGARLEATLSAFLADPAEDIYTVQDGKPLSVSNRVSAIVDHRR